MKKSLQFIISISCLVITGLFIYYFTSYIPQRDMVSLRKECINLGEKKVEQYKAESKELKNGEIAFSDYVFDSKNKRCLYKSIFNGSALTEKDIYDLFTNKKLAGYSQSGDRIIDGNIGEYRLLEIDYFDLK